MGRYGWLAGGEDGLQTVNRDVPSRSGKREIDRALYKERRLVECFFNRIKRFRRIALRCEKTTSSFKAFVDIACAMIWPA